MTKILFFFFIISSTLLAAQSNIDIFKTCAVRQDKLVDKFEETSRSTWIDIPKIKSPKAENNLLFGEFVKLNSKVKVLYLNNNKELTVCFIENQVTDLSKENGIQYLNIKTPLGESLKNKKVGDIVKIGALDNFVKILEINN